MRTFYFILNILTFGFSGQIIYQRRRHSKLTRTMDECHDYEKEVLGYITDNRRDEDNYMMMRHNYSILSKMSKYNVTDHYNVNGNFKLDHTETMEMYIKKIDFIKLHFGMIPYIQQKEREKNIEKLL